MTRDSQLQNDNSHSSVDATPARRQVLKSLNWTFIGLLLGSRIGQAQTVKALRSESNSSRSSRSQTGNRRLDEKLPRNMEDMQAFMQQKREEMKLERLEQTKKQLGVTDQEWNIIKPRLLAVEECQAQFDGRPEWSMSLQKLRDRDNTDRTGNAVYDSRNQLQQLLADKKASTQIIKEKLTALRKVQGQARQKLAKSRQDLRSLLTLRQEAYLVTTRVLD